MSKRTKSTVKIKKPDKHDLNFYLDALDISNKKFYSKTYFISQLPHSLKKWGESIFELSFPWIAEVLNDICKRYINLKDMDIDQITTHLYLFVAVFNCIKRLLLLYMKTYEDEFQTTELLQTVVSAACMVAWKGLSIDEPCVEYIEVKQFVYYCAGACKKADLIRIEREMFKLSDYKSCMKEHQQMVLYLEGP